MVEQLNINDRRNLPLIKINPECGSNIEIIEVISDYLAERWEEHRNLLMQIPSESLDNFDMSRRERFKEILISDMKENTVAVPYRLNPQTFNDGWFIGLRGGRIFSYFSENLVYIYNQEGFIEVIYKRNTSESNEVELDLYNQIIENFSPEGLDNVEELQLFHYLLDIFVKANIVNGINNLKSPFLIDSEINEKLMSILEIPKLHEFNAEHLADELSKDIAKIKKDIWTKKFKIIVKPEINGVLIKQNLEPIFVINNSGIVDLIKNKVIYKNNENRISSKLDYNLNDALKALDNYYATEFNRPNEKLILKSFSKTIKRLCSKKKFLGVF